MLPVVLQSGERSFTCWVSRTMTTPLSSRSDSRPKAVVSIEYRCASNSAADLVQIGLGVADGRVVIEVDRHAAGRRPWRSPCSGRSCRTSWWRRRRTSAASRPPAAPPPPTTRRCAPGRRSTAAGCCDSVRSRARSMSWKASGGGRGLVQRGLAQPRHRGRWALVRPGARRRRRSRSGSPCRRPTARRRDTPPPAAPAPGIRTQASSEASRMVNWPALRDVGATAEQSTGSGGFGSLPQAAVAKRADQQGPAGKGSGHVGQLRGGGRGGQIPSKIRNHNGF